MAAFVSTTNAFFFITIFKILPEPEHKALQASLNDTESCRRKYGQACQPFCHLPNPLGSLTSLYPFWYYMGIGGGWLFCLVFEDDKDWTNPWVVCVMLLPKVGSCCLPFKSQLRAQFPRKECLLSFICWWKVGRVDFCPKADCPSPQLATSGARAFIDRGRGLLAKTAVSLDSHFEIGHERLTSVIWM